MMGKNTLDCKDRSFFREPGHNMLDDALGKIE